MTMEQAQTDGVLKVDALRKVTVELTAGTGKDDEDLVSRPMPFTYIHSVAPEGMSPFEQALQGKAPGETALLEIRAGEAQAFFEHLKPQILEGLEGEEPYFLRARLTDVLMATDREIVQAMAKRTGDEGCGGGCGCGCGC